MRAKDKSYLLDTELIGHGHSPIPIHNSSPWPSLLSFIGSVLFGAVPFWVATILWSDTIYPVDREKCRNSCFDTVFKGPYESGVSNYKHVYFNCTWNTFKMWTITVVGILIVYETFKRIFGLLFNGQLRWPMLFLLATSVHSNFYGWWGTWNYWNDDFYAQWYHQLFFTFTEMTTSSIVVYYLDRKVAMQPLPLIILGNICLFHIWASGVDQFVMNVLFQIGKQHQILRDLFLMQSDIFHTCIALYYLRGLIPRGESLIPILCSRRNVLIMLTLTFSMYFALASVPNLK